MDIIRILRFKFLLVLTMCFWLSCQKYETQIILNEIESYIFDKPDSALVALESIDLSRICNTGNRAHHALLHVMALDKNYIDVDSDSIPYVAAKYYRKKGPRKNYVRSLYYLGLSYYYSKEYDKAIVEFSKAENIAEKFDSLYLGFIKVAQADIYSLNYNSVEEQKCLEEAFDVYMCIKADYYVDVAQMRLARSYISNKRFDEADSLLLSLINKTSLDDKIKQLVYLDYAFLNIINPDCDAELSTDTYDYVLSHYENPFMTTNHYWAYACALHYVGRVGDANDIICQLDSIDNSGTAAYWKYRISRLDKDTKESLELLEESVEKDEEEILRSLKASLAVAQRDYYESVYQISEYKNEVKDLTIIIICLLSVLLLLFVVGNSVILINKQKADKEKYLQYAEEISRQLKDLDMNAEKSLKNKYIALYKEKYTTLGKLFEEYVLSNGRIDKERIIYKKVVAIIEELRNDMNNSQAFESMLDNDLYGVMTNLRKEMPKLKEKDYLLFGYVALGFDTTVISHFMNCTANTIYIRKSRLRRKIEEADPKHKSQFFDIFV